MPKGESWLPEQESDPLTEVAQDILAKFKTEQFYRDYEHGKVLIESLFARELIYNEELKNVILNNPFVCLSWNWIEKEHLGIHTLGHVVRCTNLGYMICKGKVLGDTFKKRSKRDLLLLVLMLHDIGKVNDTLYVYYRDAKTIVSSISDLIKSNKTLTDAEQEIVSYHPDISAKMIRLMDRHFRKKDKKGILDILRIILPDKELIDEAAEVVAYHHKHLAGQVNQEIILLLSIIDIYDALMSVRSYKKEKSIEKTKGSLNKNFGINKSYLVLSERGNEHEARTRYNTLINYLFKDDTVRLMKLWGSKKPEKYTYVGYLDYISRLKQGIAQLTEERAGGRS